MIAISINNVIFVKKKDSYYVTNCNDNPFGQ